MLSTADYARAREMFSIYDVRPTVRGYRLSVQREDGGMAEWRYMGVNVWRYDETSHHYHEYDLYTDRFDEYMTAADGQEVGVMSVGDGGGDGGVLGGVNGTATTGYLRHSDFGATTGTIRINPDTFRALVYTDGTTTSQPAHNTNNDLVYTGSSRQRNSSRATIADMRSPF